MAETLMDALTDIRRRLLKKEYKNEEHVRFSLVGRVLMALGWDIWNPLEVCTEHQPLAGENFTKVDISLNIKGEDEKTVYLECKGVGKLKNCLEKVEEQMLNYNKRNGAKTIVLTDGRFWYLYSGEAKGTLRERQLFGYDLAQDDLAQTAVMLAALLGRSVVAEGATADLMEKQLKLRRRYLKMTELEEEAKKLSRRPPRQSPALALMNLMHQASFSSSTESETRRFLEGGRYDLAIQVLQAKANTLKLLLAKEPGTQNEAAARAAAKATPAAKTQKTNTTQIQLPFGGKNAATAKKSLTPQLFVLAGRGANATGVLLSNGRMQILRDSTAAGSVTKAFNKKEVRSALLTDKVVVRRKGVLLFTRSYTFESPVVAAHVICGDSIAAISNWRHETTNQTLGEFKAKGNPKG